MDSAMQRSRQAPIRGSMAGNSFPSSSLPVRTNNQRGPWDPFSQSSVSPNGGRAAASRSRQGSVNLSSMAGNQPPITAVNRQWASTIHGWPGPTVPQMSTSSSNDWTFVGFSATISNLQQLSDEIGHPTNGSGRSRSPTVDITRSTSAHGSIEVFSHSFAEGRFKCDIFKSPTLPWASSEASRASDPLSASQNTGQNHLSLYLSSRQLNSRIICSWLIFIDMNETDLMGQEVVVPTSIYVALRDSKQESATPIWELWQLHTFGDTSDYMECHTFPLPSALLQNPKIRQSDSIILSVQIQSPVSASAASAKRAASLAIPQFPNARLAPKTLLSGLLDMLDCPHTSDVEITVFERSSPFEASNEEADLGTSQFETEEQPILYRKRTLFAHSAILRARSSYFDAMLGGTDWNESASETNGKRRHRVTLEFDYVAVYWLLRFLYSDQITFHENDMTQNLPRNEPTTIPVNQLTTTWQRLDQIAMQDETDQLPSRRSASDPVTSHTTAYYRRSPHDGRNFAATSRCISQASGLTDATLSLSDGVSVVDSNEAPVMADPHPHPFAVETPASAIAIYQIAHAYGLTSLARLSLDHIVDNLTPSTAFPLLLWTHLYSELHKSIKIYAYRNWYDIVHSESYRACMDEVAMGNWPSSGEVLYELTRSLAPSMSTL